MNKVKSFIKEFVAVVTGDDATAKGEKAFRQANSALKSQISSLEGDTVNLEDAIEDANEAQRLARVNGGEPIINKKLYLENLINAKNNVITAEENLQDHKAQIAFLEGELESLSTDVEG